MHELAEGFLDVGDLEKARFWCERGLEGSQNGEGFEAVQYLMYLSVMVDISDRSGHSTEASCYRQLIPNGIEGMSLLAAIVEERMSGGGKTMQVGTLLNPRY
jgi:hypothetical protein